MIKQRLKHHREFKIKLFNSLLPEVIQGRLQDNWIFDYNYRDIQYNAMHIPKFWNQIIL